MLRAWLDAARADIDAPFDVAAAPLRLVTAYRGPGGLDWVSPRFVAALARGEQPGDADLRRLEPGDVAILRGRGGDGPGVPHRAASAGGAALRLFIDEVGHARGRPSPEDAAHVRTLQQRPNAAEDARPPGDAGPVPRAVVQPPNSRISTASQSRST